MEFFADLEFWKRRIRIALAVRSLPAREQFCGRIFGTAGAVGLRLVFVFLVSWLMQIPFLQLVGGLVLAIPLVVWGSGVLVKMMNHFPVIIWLGGGMLGFVAAELIHKAGGGVGCA